MEMMDPAQLTRDLGGQWQRSYGVAPCPVCQSERRKDQNALTIRTNGDRLLMHCKKLGCDFKDILTASGITPGHVEIDRIAAENAERERKADDARKLARARSMWDVGQPIQGTNGEEYLRGRGITCPLPDSLRWLPDTYHQPTGRYCSAMVGDVSTGAPSGQYHAAIVASVQPTGGIHRTFFTKKGERLSKSAKMMLGPCAGGTVRLSDSAGPLVVCEGIETGLSLLSGLLSGPHTVWAALSTSGVKGLSLPARASSLIIAPDGDPAGREAANVLAMRAHGLGWDVSIMEAPDAQDWNDVLQGGVAA